MALTPNTTAFPFRISGVFKIEIIGLGDLIYDYKPADVKCCLAIKDQVANLVDSISMLLSIPITIIWWWKN